MPTITISALPVASSGGGTDVLPIVQSSITKQLSINNPDDVMAMPYSLIATRQRFNIFAGNY